MKVKEVLKSKKGGTLFSVAPDSKLSDAVVTMADQDIGSLMVMEGGKLTGILTFREVIDMLAKRQREGRKGPTPPVNEINVRDALYKDPFTAHLDMEVDELRSEMLKRHARYVPVMDGDSVLGVISFHDVAKAVLEERNFENQMLKGYIKNWPA
jgi:CBS domain-containing protein